MSRKGENIYKRKDGRWKARYIKGRSETGKAIYGYVYGRSYKDAKSKREQALRLLDQVNSQSNSHIADDCAFKEITDKWMLSVAPQVKASTYNKYKNLTRINRKSLFYIFPLCVTLKKKGVFHYVTYG